MKYNIGKVSLIKNGETKDIDINVNEETAIEEIKKIENLLEQKAKEGCSSILNINNVALNIKTKKSKILDEKNLNIFISENITSKDYINLMKGCLKDPKDFHSIIIKNYVQRNGYHDYDVYDYKQNILPEKKECSEEENLRRRKNNATRMPSDIVDLFLRRKLNKLTEKEKIMYEKYENFNLEDILFSNDREKFSLNNGNAGVITIFEDHEYKTPVTKMQHSVEKDKHIDWYREDTNDNRKDPNYIYIQLMPEEVICWLPEKLNEYQLKRMQELTNDIKKIETVNHDIKTFTGIVKESAEFNTTIKEYENLSQLDAYLKNQGKKQR